MLVCGGLAHNDGGGRAGEETTKFMMIRFKIHSQLFGPSSAHSIDALPRTLYSGPKEYFSLQPPQSDHLTHL